MKKRMDYGILAIKPDAHKPFKKGQKIRILQRHYDLYFKGVKPKKEQIKTISRVSRIYKSDWDIYTTDGYGYSFDCVEIVQKSKK